MNSDINSFIARIFEKRFTMVAKSIFTREKILLLMILDSYFVESISRINSCIDITILGSVSLRSLGKIDYSN